MTNNPALAREMLAMRLDEIGQNVLARQLREGVRVQDMFAEGLHNILGDWGVWLPVLEKALQTSLAEREAVVKWLRSDGPDRDNGGPCRHVEHSQGYCSCPGLADAIKRCDHLTADKGGDGEEDQGVMAHPPAEDRAGALRVEPSTKSQAEPLIPCAGDAEIVMAVRETAADVTGGNCAFADDDVKILGALAERAIVAGLTDGLNKSVIDNIDQKYGRGKYASGIEAGTDATAQTGAAEGKSPVAESETPDPLGEGEEYGITPLSPPKG